MNYYNEFDKKTCLWLKELIKENLIPEGVVDERSITEVQAKDLKGYNQCHFFAGVGGWSYALRIAGVPDDFPIWTASLPCQPFSVAGKQKGEKDERHLFPVFNELVKRCHPQWIVGEQVSAAIRLGWIDGVQTELEKECYSVRYCVLGAHSIGAPHIRQRLYWVGRLAENPDGIGRGRRGDGDTTGDNREIQTTGLGNDGGVGNSNSIGMEKSRIQQSNTFTEPSADGGVAHTESTRNKRTSGATRDEERGQGNALHGVAGGTSATGGVGDCDCARCKTRNGISCGGKEGSRKLEGTGNNCGVADTNSGGRSSGIDTGSGAEASGRGQGDFESYNRGKQIDTFIPCRDGKYRRVPTQSVLQRVVDGTSSKLDTMHPEDGFPLCKKGEVKNRVMLLKGFGNAIVPTLAAEFIKAVLDE